MDKNLERELRCIWIIISMIAIFVGILICTPIYIIVRTEMYHSEVDAIIARRYALLAPLLNETAENSMRKITLFVLNETIDVLDVYLEVFLPQQIKLQEAYRDISVAASSYCAYHDDDHVPLVGLSLVNRTYQVALDRLLKSVARLGVNCGYSGLFSEYSMFDTMHSCSLYRTNPSFMTNAVRLVPE